MGKGGKGEKEKGGIERWGERKTNRQGGREEGVNVEKDEREQREKRRKGRRGRKGEKV